MKICRVLTSLLLSLFISKIAIPAEPDQIPVIHGQSHDSLALQGKSKITWKRAVDQRITAQGIAWGKVEKGLGDRVILDGTTIYVVGRTPFEKYGRLVEVSGQLELKRIPPAPATSQGFGPKGVEYYVVSDARWRYIDEVSHPHLVVRDEK